VVEAQKFLNSAKARRFAQAHARRQGLDLPGEDVTSEAVINIWKRVDRNPTGLDDANVEAYCTTVIKRVVRDAARGRSDSMQFDEERDAPGGRGNASELMAPTQLEEASSSIADELRAAIECDDSIPDWVAAAALNFVTLTSHPDVNVSGAPKPEAGARPDQALMWPSLWFAGRRDGLFPDPADDAARRKRRSRAAMQVAGAFKAAVVRAHFTEAAHG
jgi:hypothetical protein